MIGQSRVGESIVYLAPFLSLLVCFGLQRSCSRNSYDRTQKRSLVWLEKVCTLSWSIASHIQIRVLENAKMISGVPVTLPLSSSGLTTFLTWDLTAFG